MAKSTVTTPAFEPEGMFNVRLTKVVQVGRLRLLPINTHQMKGGVLSQIVSEHGPGVVDRADPVQEAVDAADA
ncbi:MAG: hypothetical protein B7Z40_13460 [Bosea sp. 12-68-7]|nr:MAG: hypothetical protein B7Z40_13460 [Bosea sp. 12-68-7]